MVLGMLALDCRDSDDFIQPLDRQGPEEEAVDESEDGGVDADSQRQGEDHRAGKSGLLDQQPKRVAEIGH